MLVSVGNRIPEDQKPAYMRRPTHGCPIDKLPDDILLEIFLIGVAVQLELRDNRNVHSLSSNHTQLPLTDLLLRDI